MAATEEMELAMQARYEAMKAEGTALQRFRAYTMSKGVKGIRTIGRVFKQMDDNGDRRLQKHEFCEGMVASGELDMDKATIEEVFNEMDTTGNGELSYDEFLVALRPPISDDRMELIDAAFAKFDKSEDGQINLEDLRGVYSASFHPKFQSGEWTEDQVFEHWLSQFNTHGGGYITKEDFVNYYVGVSSSIDDDVYFVEMMKQAWKL